MMRLINSIRGGAIPSAILVALSLLLAGGADARPLLSRVATMQGQYSFEGGASISQRWDSYGSPENKYETVIFPVFARLGLTDRLDIGLSMEYMDHRVEYGDARYSGSGSAMVSPEIKVGLTKDLSLLGIWHAPSAESEDELSVTRGSDYELLVAWGIPTIWPITFNVGYVWKGNYDSREGVPGGPLYEFDPGNIFESRGAVEVPLIYNFSLLTELAYYYVDTLSVGEQAISNSSGDAMDVLVGLTWAWQGWNIGTGVAFGLLDESHTSFDLERGAGDYKLQFNLAYRLARKKYLR